MTRGKKLLVLLGTLLLLTAVTWVVKQLAAEKAPEESVSPLLAIDGETVTALSWSYGDQSFRFERNDGAWHFPEDESFPVSKTKMEQLLSTLNGIIVKKTIQEPETLSEYGLESLNCTVERSQGSPITLRWGMESPLGGRYLTLDGSTVYLVEEQVVSSFQVDLYAMLRQESIPAFNHITKVTVERKGEDLVLRKDSDRWLDQKGQELDTALVSDFLTTVTALYWSDTITHNADERQLREYGLLSPKAVVTVDYSETTQVPTELKNSAGQPIMEAVTEEKTFVLELGNATQEGVYARLAGSPMVYEIYDSYGEELLRVTTEQLLPQADGSETA